MDDPKWLQDLLKRAVHLWTHVSVPGEDWRILLAYIRELRTVLAEAQGASMLSSGMSEMRWSARQRILDREEPPEVKS